MVNTQRVNGARRAQLYEASSGSCRAIVRLGFFGIHVSMDTEACAAMLESNIQSGLRDGHSRGHPPPNRREPRSRNASPKTSALNRKS